MPMAGAFKQHVLMVGFRDKTHQKNIHQQHNSGVCRQTDELLGVKQGKVKEWTVLNVTVSHEGVVYAADAEPVELVPKILGWSLVFWPCTRTTVMKRSRAIVMPRITLLGLT
jgi:hypothetical protein